jgi:hypothetical protein
LNDRWTTWYRRTSLFLAVVFAAVGILFLFLPGTVLRFFNDLSPHFGLLPSGGGDVNLFVVLAAAYMYVVSLLAWLMYRHPDQDLPPIILINAKLASSLLSFALFLFVVPSLALLVNGVVDGCLGGGVWWMVRQRRMTS